MTPNKKHFRAVSDPFLKKQEVHKNHRDIAKEKAQLEAKAAAYQARIDAWLERKEAERRAEEEWYNQIRRSHD